MKFGKVKGKDIVPIDIVKNVAKNNYTRLLILIAILFLVGNTVRSGYISFANISNIMSVSSILAILTAAQIVIIIGGGEGINLSLGPIMSMGALIGANFVSESNKSIPIAVLILIVLGIIGGLITGIGVQWFKIAPLVMTLIMATLVDGFVFAYTRGLPTGTIPLAMLHVGKPIFGTVSWVLIIAVLVILFFRYFLKKTKLGRQIFLIGSNREAAALCGINVNRNVILAYIISDVIGILCGFLYLGYVGTAILRMANGYTLLCVAAAIIGGTKIAGGEGTLIGGALGAIVLILLTSVLLVLGMSPGVRQFVEGLFLLIILMATSRGPRLRQ